MGPFSKNARNTIKACGELSLIEHLGRWFAPAVPPYPVGIGDDCAILPPSLRAEKDAAPSTLWTNDSLVLGRHFEPSCPANLAGGKLLKRCLSDIAACGGMPSEALLAFFLPAETRLSWLEDFCRGIADVSQRWKVRIVGGDVTETGDFLGATCALSGWAEHPIRRRGAVCGASFYVSGPLGGSLAGHHLDFSPRLPEGRFLSSLGLPINCIDLTDGLAKDLPELLPPDTAAALEIPRIPLTPAAREHSGDSLRAAFCDGEDYELLWTLPPQADEQAFAQKWQEQFGTPPFRIGQIVPRSREFPEALFLDADSGEALDGFQGYEHFRKT
jgi:thiamine-monophosphate kinase